MYDQKQTSHRAGIDLEHYVRLLLRQKWFLILPAILGVVVMTLFSLTLINQYTAKATILVEPQSIPTEFLRSTVSGGPETYVRSLVEQVKSMSRLEKVIEEFDLYPEARQKRSLEEVVAAMREKIEIERRGSDTFSIAFTGSDPVKVQAVTNKITEMFIEENLNYRLANASRNVQFLEEQAKKLREQVSTQERLIQQFKTANLDALPDYRGAIQTQLNAAQQRYQSNAEALARAQAQLLAIRDRVSLLSEYRVAETGGANVDEPKDPVAVARQELAQLKARLSERHPDVKIKQAELEALEKAARQSPRRVQASDRLTRSPEYLRAREEERMAQAQIESLSREQARLNGSIAELSKRLEATPRVELELSELTKGLQVLRDEADNYQKKATDASASLALERGAYGSQFRPLDKARLPQKPVSPNRPVLVAIGGLVGLAIGLLLVIGLDLLFRPFLDEQDLARFTGIQVLVSIPHVGPFPSEWQRFRGQLSNLVGYLRGTMTMEEEYVPEELEVPEEAGAAADLADGGGPGLAGSGRTAQESVPPRGANTSPGGARGRAPAGPRPIITRAAARGYHEDPVRSPAQGNGRVVYSSATTTETNGLNGRTAEPVRDRYGFPGTRPVELVVEPVDLRPQEAGPAVAFRAESEVQRYPVVKAEERLPVKTAGPQTGLVLGGNWGSPTRYVITARPVAGRASGAEETMKELFRRPPWGAAEES